MPRTSSIAEHLEYSPTEYTDYPSASMEYLEHRFPEVVRIPEHVEYHATDNIYWDFHSISRTLLKYRVLQTTSGTRLLETLGISDYPGYLISENTDRLNFFFNIT